MKQFLIVIFIILSFSLFAEKELSLQERIEKFSGKNSEELLNILETQEGDTFKYAKFLLENCTANDLSVLTKDYLLKNIRFAMKTKDFIYSELYPEDIFQHFVLPYRASQEPLEDYREQFYDELKPLVEEIDNIEEAAILVNLWCYEQMTFKRTNGRDQGPLTTIKRGYGRCEEMMIIFITAARSVGIPCRSASVPYWSFTDNNHAWVEIWTPDSWKYTGAAEPKNTLNKAWFTKTSQRATLITSRAFGNYESKNTIKQEDNVTTISSIEYYTDFEYIQIKVKDENNEPVIEASVILYGTSYGGLFALTKLETDDSGIVNIPLGKGTVFVTAFKDDKFDHSLLNTMKNSSLELKLTEDKNLDENFVFLFPIPFDDPDKAEHEGILEDKFDLMHENSNLKRNDRLNNLKKSNEFAKYYDLANMSENRDSIYFENRKEFLDKTDELAANSSQYLKIFQRNENDSLKTKILINMLVEWDIKELIEIPDSTEIDNVVNIYHDGKLRFQDSVPDSIFIDNVVHRIWRSAIPPENGWWLTLYEKINDLADGEIDKTVLNVIEWVDSKVEIDSNFVWSYFSGSLNPNDILNLKYVPEFYRTKLLVCCLKELGVPLQWKGRLEYYNGNDFVVVEEKEEEAEKDNEAEVTISIFVDGEQIKAESYKNFMIAKLGEDGNISNTFFDGKNDSLDYKAKYRRQDSDNIYVESFTRNTNGDANVVIKSFGKDENHLKIELLTPKEYLDLTEKWNKKTLKNIKKLFPKIESDNKKILFIRGEIKNEPEERMFAQISEKFDKFKETNITIYSENRDNSDISENKDFILKKGKKIITENFSENEYPVIFVLDEKNEITFSSKGYNMGIVDLLLKKVK